jgi:hypothetical protein
MTSKRLLDHLYSERNTLKSTAVYYYNDSSARCKRTEEECKELGKIYEKFSEQLDNIIRLYVEGY